MATPDMSASRRSRRRTVSLAVTGVSLAALLYLEIAKPTFSADRVTQEMISMTLTRGIGALVFLLVLLTLGYRVTTLRPRPPRRAWLYALPALLVALNNVPWVGLFSGRVTIVGSAGQIAWFLGESLAIGLFEELAFRGVVFLMLTEKRHSTRRGLLAGLLLSSAVFGLLHLTNLLVGADPGAVFLQLGYSFAIGAMCAVVLLKTANIWICVLIHTVYDVGGNMVGRIATGRLWDTPTVVITAILGVATAVFYLLAFWRMDVGETARIWSGKVTPSNPTA